MIFQNLISISEKFVYFYVDVLFITMSTVFDKSNWVSRQLVEYPDLLFSTFILFAFNILLVPLFILTATIVFIYIVYLVFYSEEDIIIWKILKIKYTQLFQF